MILALLLQTAVAATPAPARAPAQAAQAWKFADRTNAAGVRSASASVTGRDGLSRFVVKCDVASEPIVSVQFIQPTAIGQSADKAVSVRFDGGPAFTYLWQFPGTATYITDPEAITKLSSFLVKSKQVGVETTNASNFAVQAVFDAPGNDALVRKVLGVCGYTLGVVPPPPAPKDPQ
jgi:hypothetical protein